MQKGKIMAQNIVDYMTFSIVACFILSDDIVIKGVLIILAFVFARMTAILLSDNVNLKKATFNMFFSKIILLSLWDIVWWMLIAFIVAIFWATYSTLITAIISIVLYITIWIIELILVIPNIYKKIDDIKYFVANKELNLVIPNIYKKTDGIEYFVANKVNLLIVSSSQRIVIIVLYILYKAF